MRVLVTGAAGMLGTDLVSELNSRGHDAVATDLAELDLGDPESVAEITTGKFGKLDWCMNCAAYTAVDKAETEIDAATLINSVAPSYLAHACQLVGTRILHVSTDFVFDGEATEPYAEEAKTHPLGAYGRTKLDGERAIFAAGLRPIVARTAWLYGAYGNSFPKTMIKAFLAGRALKVVDDQRGTPTYTGDLARVLVDLVEGGVEPGIYHTTGPDIMTWRDFAQMAIETYQEAVLSQPPAVEIAGIKTEDWPTPAHRPKYSALSFEKAKAAGIEPMRPTKEALREFCQKLPQPLA